MTRFSDEEFSEEVFPADLHTDRAGILASLGRYEEGAREALEAIALEPHHGVALHILAQCQAGLGLLEEAEESARLAVSYYPDLFITHYGLSVVLARQGRFEEAISHALYTLELPPEQPLHYGHAAFIYSDMGLFDKALLMAEEGLFRFPTSTLCLAARGLALAKLDRTPEARVVAEELLSHDAENSWGYILLAWACIEDGHLADAQDLLATALQYQPTNWLALRELERLTACTE